MPYGKKSPTKMGHSPMENQNKGYAKQERKDLMQDMPVDKRASAMQMGHSPLEGHCMGSPNKMGHESPMKMKGSWMSKHSKSALHMGHSPAEMGHDSPARKEGEKPKTTEQLAAASRKRGKQAAMEAQAKKDKKSGAHTGKMVTVMTSTGPKKVDSRSQAAKDLPIVS